VSLLLGLLAAAVCLAFAAGCASVESDIPWGAPEPWEGSPYVPGLPQE